MIFHTERRQGAIVINIQIPAQKGHLADTDYH